MDGTIEMAALGRTFGLGMFYDCRSDQIIPAITLWDNEKLIKDMKKENKPSTEFKIVASESISAKSSSLGVGASLKASFLCGLVEVDGSAKYLNNNKTSTKQARVTLKYKVTTEFKSLTMDQLGTDNLKHSKVLDRDDATHVVTGILYGAQAFFVFDQETSEREKVQDIEGNLKVLIDKLPSIEIGTEGALKIEDKEKESVKKFSCTFHGDFLLDNSPTTFEEAVKVYKDLPGCLGPNRENVVPVKVWLYPLCKLDSNAAKLVRHISDMLVTEAQNMLEGFTDLDIWCNDVLKSPAGQNFPHISKNINKFKALCSSFKLRLQKTLAQKLRSIRGGEEDEEALAEELKKVSESPFNRERLNQWTRDKDKEVNILKTIMKLMKNTETVPSENDLSNKVSDSENALVFVLTCLESAEPFLSQLNQYLKQPQSTWSEAPEPTPWYRSQEVINSVRSKATLFSEFAEANKDKKHIQFLAVGLADESQKFSTIYMYKDGFKDSEDFELPSKPKTVIVGEVTHNTVSLSFSVPSDGLENISSYRVEYCEKGQEEWNHQPQPEPGSVAVSGLKPNTEYSVRVRAVTAVGVGPAAETSFKTTGYSGKETKRSLNSQYTLKDVTDLARRQKLEDLLKSGDVYEEELSVSQCSALAGILMSGPVLEELDLDKYKTTVEGKQRLIPVVKNCRKAWLEKCSLSDVHCAEISSALSCSSSLLRELDLSFNKLSFSSVSALCEALKSPNCQLSKLSLDDCDLSELSCSALASALKSNSSSQLSDLSLNGNSAMSEFGVKNLCGFLQSPDCRLQKLELWACGLSQISCFSLASALSSNSSSELTLLDLSKNPALSDSGVKDLCGFLKRPNCLLQILKLWGCGLTEISCSFLASALSSNSSSQLTELYLNDNPALKDSGVKHLCGFLKSPNCLLQVLDLRACGLSKASCSSLASALSSNSSSQLSLLDLDNNLALSNAGVKDLCGFLKRSNCPLQTLGLRACGLSKTSCSSLASALKSNPSSQLSGLYLDNNPALSDYGVKDLCGFLKRSNCPLQTLGLGNCDLSGNSCSSLASALSSNSSSQLSVLDLDNNLALSDSGVKDLCDFLKSPDCLLQTLRLVNCGLSKTSCLYLASALKSNFSSQLSELDLQDNDLSDADVEELLQLKHCSDSALEAVKWKTKE